MTVQSFIAIDPGQTHCGVALFTISMNPESGLPECECTFTTEHTPEGMFDNLRVWGAMKGNSKGGFDVFVVEAFRLYPEKMASLAYSELRTVEVIGALRERCRVESVPFVTQPASIKKATEGQLRARGIALKSKGGGSPHAHDAELHGWHYWLRMRAGL